MVFRISSQAIKENNMALMVDFNKEPTLALQGPIMSLTPKTGFCIMADVCGSTDMKYKVAKQEWIANLHNTFRMCHNWALKGVIPVLKTVGDELMYFINCDADTEIAASIFVGLFDAITIVGDRWISEIKCSVSYCNEDAEVYNLTFTPNVIDDYYGKGIDLTARLISLVKKNREIIYNGDLHELLIQAQQNPNINQDIKEQLDSILGLSEGPTNVKLKGIPFPVTTYKISMPD